MISLAYYPHSNPHLNRIKAREDARDEMQNNFIPTCEYRHIKCLLWGWDNRRGVRVCKHPASLAASSGRGRSLDELDTCPMTAKIDLFKEE